MSEASSKANPIDPLGELDRALEAHQDLPPEALIKQDMLRLGLRFDPQALAPSAYKAKDYFIFSFDMAEGSKLSAAERLRAPEEIRFHGGPHGFSPTVVSVRLNPHSPYSVRAIDGRLELQLQDRVLAEAEYQPVPAYYGRTLSNGKQVSEIAPAIEWGYLLYLTVFRTCQYFGKQDECRFCDINANFRQQREAGRPYTGVKSVEEVLEALRLAHDLDPVSGAYTVTGGSITTRLAGMSEVEFYVRYIEAIEQEFGGRWVSKLVTQVQPPEALERLKRAGLQILHPNYEVWDPRMFELLCPGKARLIGRGNWNRMILEAAEVFGPGCVIPNFVAGVELIRPEGFDSVESAIGSLAEGLDYFMSRGVCPRFTTWCPEPLAGLGDRPPAPLGYYGQLLRVWRETFERYSLPVPPGYGPAGVGRAVFSVSAFMDVIRSDG